MASGSVAITDMSVQQLVDRYGALNNKVSALEGEQKLIKEEFGRRGLSNAQRGKKFIVTISESSSTRLDTKAMREDPKLAKLLPAFEKTTTSIRFTVKPAPKEVR